MVSSVFMLDSKVHIFFFRWSSKTGHPARAQLYCLLYTAGM